MILFYKNNNFSNDLKKKACVTAQKITHWKKGNILHNNHAFEPSCVYFALFK